MKKDNDQQPEPDLVKEESSSPIQQAILKIESLEKFNQMLLQQIMDLSKSVYSQSTQIKQSEGKILDEIHQLRRVPLPKAMGTILYKMAGELIAPVNQLDELLQPVAGQNYSEEELTWINALEISRNQLENILAKWGCVPIKIDIGKEEFDPEIHQSVEGEATEEQTEKETTIEENIIRKIVRRGWRLNDQIMQYPQVIVHQ